MILSQNNLKIPNASRRMTRCTTRGRIRMNVYQNDLQSKDSNGDQSFCFYLLDNHMEI